MDAVTREGGEGVRSLEIVIHQCCSRVGGKGGAAYSDVERRKKGEVSLKARERVEERAMAIAQEHRSIIVG